MLQEVCHLLLFFFSVWFVAEKLEEIDRKFVNVVLALDRVWCRILSALETWTWILGFSYFDFRHFGLVYSKCLREVCADVVSLG